MLWRIVVALSEHLSTAFRSTIHEFSREIDGAEQQLELGKLCLTQANKHFGMVLGSLFVQQHFSSQSKAKVWVGGKIQSTSHFCFVFFTFYLNSMIEKMLLHILKQYTTSLSLKHPWMQAIGTVNERARKISLYTNKKCSKSAKTLCFFVQVWLYCFNYMHFSSFADGNKQPSSGYCKTFSQISVFWQSTQFKS